MNRDMNIRKLLKWFWRVLLFPFVVAIWLSAGIIMGLVIPCDWLINSDKWNGLNRKEEKNG